MAKQTGHVVDVTRQEGDRVLLSIPMVGFPAGWNLSPGDKAVLVNDENGLSVRPLVRSFLADDVSEEAEALVADGRRLASPAAMVRAEGRAAGRGGRYLVFVVESGSSGGPDRVISIRPLR